MRDIFSADSGLMRFLNAVADFVLLNIVFVLTCIPVITIGPALSALYSVTLKLAAKDDIYVIKSYFRAFRANFAQSLKAWLLILGAAAVLGVNVRACMNFTFVGRNLVMILLLIMAAVLSISVVFIFPMIAKFENPLKHQFINSLCMPLSKPLSLVTVLTIQVIPVLLALYSAKFFLVWSYMLVMGWFALMAYFSSFFLNRLFRYYIMVTNIGHETCQKG